MIIYIDIDETICMSPRNRDYSEAVPVTERICKINKLYDEGNIIVYWTARGSGSGIDWSEVTKEQLIKWKAKHHDLKLGKPVYDLFICDKAVNSIDFFKEKNGTS